MSYISNATFTAPMRPTARRQSALRAPLNEILATEANVRILRVLTESASAVTPGDLARLALLQRSSVYRALGSLVKTGVVEHVGAGGTSRVELSKSHPLSRSIAALFAAERGRADTLVAELRKAALALDPPPRAAWLDPAVSVGTDLPGEPVVVCVLESPPELPGAVDRLRAAVERLEGRLDVTVQVRGLTASDLQSLPNTDQDRLIDAVTLVGPPPAGFVERLHELRKARNIISHGDHDERALALATLIADRVVRDPSLIRKARDYVTARLAKASARERHDLEEWDRLLRSASPARLRRILTDPGEHATRLRQTLPFIGILSTTERTRLGEAQAGKVPASRRAPRPPKATRARKRK